MSPRLHTLLKSEQHLKKDETATRYFYKPDGDPRDVGMVVRNAALAEVLREVAAKGADAFYTGAIAKDIAAKVRSHPTNPGQMAEQDLAGYQPKKRDAMCSDWKQYRLCGFPPPSSGHIAIAQMLGIMEHAPKVSQPLDNGVPSVELLHTYTEAARLAFADRALYVADPDFVQPPAGSWRSLIDPAYLKERAAAIGPQSMKTAAPGVPRGGAVAFAPQPEQIERGTSHISIVDPYGNAIAMTTTIEDQFGARQMVRGFLLNNELTDFDFTGPHPNVPEAGKRPRSSMTPTIALKDGKPAFSIGSPGGSTIITTVLQTIVNYIDLGMPMDQAIDAPRLSQRNSATTDIEPGYSDSEQAKALMARGQRWSAQAEDIGAANALVFNADGTVTAVSEGRRHGVGSAGVQRQAR